MLIADQFQLLGLERAKRERRGKVPQRRKGIGLHDG